MNKVKEVLKREFTGWKLWQVVWIIDSSITSRGVLLAGFPGIPTVIPGLMAAASAPSMWNARQEMQRCCLVGGQHCSATAKHTHKQGRQVFILG